MYVVGHFHYVLSMGAIFAIFAGFYYWIEKIVGLEYNFSLANLHFFLFFFGVNIIFFPLHFLGLAGMPRRICDFPDFYQGWNVIASFGSTISFLASLLFFYVFFDMLVYGKKVINKSPYSVKILTWKLFFDRINNWYSSIKIVKIVRASFFNLYLLYDIAVDWQFGFQDSATELMSGIIDLHHDIMFFFNLNCSFSFVFIN
jgi:heme/copper-type cytochrome/quinol oxidase subunit 1